MGGGFSCGASHREYSFLSVSSMVCCLKETGVFSVFRRVLTECCWKSVVVVVGVWRTGAGDEKFE